VHPFFIRGNDETEILLVCMDSNSLVGMSQYCRFPTFVLINQNWD